MLFGAEISSAAPMVCSVAMAAFAKYVASGTARSMRSRASRERRSGSAGRSSLHRRGDARGLCGARQAGGRKTHLLFIRKGACTCQARSTRATGRHSAQATCTMQPGALPDPCILKRRTQRPNKACYAHRIHVFKAHMNGTHAYASRTIQQPVQHRPRRVTRQTHRESCYRSPCPLQHMDGESSPLQNHQ